ncbi:MAG: hypothetical protein EAZ89_16365 [Bacteroidetes bacterium]|nr:MAG: hypothetical protein EAZ89_16365 [Bacteroidota bacterium]
MLKQEEDFLNISYQGSGLYAFSPFLSARFYYRSRGTRLLGQGVSDSLLLRQLDGLRRTAGVGFEYENLDYRNNPSRGWTGKLDLGIGQRTIRRNVLLPDRVYEGLDLRQPVREILLELKWYHQLFERQILHLANRSAWLGMEQYYRNDQWQLGGARSIRGFNENQLFADFYTFFTAEYRFQLERDSYLFAFFDYAWLDDRNLNQQQRPAGLGLGMNYGTKAGIISLVYAVGSNGSTPFQPSRGKVHIGIVNLF